MSRRWPAARPIFKCRRSKIKCRRSSKIEAQNTGYNDALLNHVAFVLRQCSTFDVRRSSFPMPSHRFASAPAPAPGSLAGGMGCGAAAERGVAVELVPITTQGDVKTGPLGQIGGQGLFTKEFSGRCSTSKIDLAVHS